MDISQLQTVIQVAETGSISKASERLNIVQPALSRKLGNLEKELGTMLFERHGRGMVPTQVGRSVLRHALTIMSELDAIHELTSSQSGPLLGEVTVGITPTIAEIVTVPLIEKVKATHPDLSIRFVSAFSGFLLEWLQRGEVDLALSYETTETVAVHTHPAMVEELLVVGPGQRFCEAAACVRFADLAKERLILPGARHGLRKILDQCALQASTVLEPVIEVDSLNAMVALVKADFGCTVLPLPPVHDLVRQGLLSVARIIEPEPKRTVVIASSVLKPASAAARFVERTFLDIVREMVEKKKWTGVVLDTVKL